MSQQVLARDLLILGDSNIRRYLYRAGGAYSQTCDCWMARNMTEFGTAIKMVESTNYRIVVFAMLTNIVIDTGSSGHDHSTRMDAIEECISPLLKNLRYYLLSDAFVYVPFLSLSYEVVYPEFPCLPPQSLALPINPLLASGNI
jgi:hypothetical protein